MQQSEAKDCTRPHGDLWLSAGLCHTLYKHHMDRPKVPGRTAAAGCWTHRCPWPQLLSGEMVKGQRAVTCIRGCAPEGRSTPMYRTHESHLVSRQNGPKRLCIDTDSCMPTLIESAQTIGTPRLRAAHLTGERRGAPRPSQLISR